MNKVYTFLAFTILVISTVTVFYLSYYPILDSAQFKEKIIEISLERTVNVDKKKLFDTMSDLENYPNVLPENFKRIKIISESENSIIAEEVIRERGIELTILAKHTIIPYEKHIIEVQNGDAQGSVIILNFEEEGSSTKINADIKLHIRGVLAPFSFLVKDNVAHAATTIITAFAEYAKFQI